MLCCQCGRAAVRVALISDASIQAMGITCRGIGLRSGLPTLGPGLPALFSGKLDSI